MDLLKYPSAILLLALASAAGISCSLDEIPPEGIRIRNLEISGGTDSLPDAFPAFSNYSGASIPILGTYKTESNLSTPEGAAFLHAADSLQTVQDYYYRSFSENGWNIIQSHTKESEALIMAESPFGKLITVIMRSNAGTDIKIYVKRLGGD